MHKLLFKYRTEERLIFGDDYHYYLEIPVLYDSENHLNEKIHFLIDTGAFITVINKATSGLLTFDKLPSIVEGFSLTGFAGSCSASIKEIPGLVIGGRLIKGVRVAIPNETTKHNILGMNVLEHFVYLLDTENNNVSRSLLDFHNFEYNAY